jgi:uncharacterized membrane protein
MLIIVLAVAAFSIRVLGLVAGNTIKSSRYAWVLDELPGLIVISLVASSLAGHSIGTWIAAGAAFCVAYYTNHVIWTMCSGVVAYAILHSIGI